MMDEYVKQIIKNSYKHLILAIEYSNRFIVTQDGSDLESVRCHVIDAMANLEQTEIFERGDALLIRNEFELSMEELQNFLETCRYKFSKGNQRDALLKANDHPGEY
jgi:hypothetical protein